MMKIIAENKKINNMAELQEMIALTKPGTEVNITVNRDGKDKTLKVKLQKNEEVSGVGETKTANMLGAKFEKVDKDTKARLGISGGIEVAKLSNGKLRSEGVREGFIILKANNQNIRTVEDLSTAFKTASNSAEQTLWIWGKTPAGKSQSFAVIVGEE